jgi:hypothetical protein
MAEELADGMAVVIEHCTEADIMGDGIITMEAAIITRALDIIPISRIIMADIIHTHITMDTMLNLPRMEKHARITQARR